MATLNKRNELVSNYIHKCKLLPVGHFVGEPLRVLFVRYQVGLQFQHVCQHVCRRQCGPVVRALALRSIDLEFKTQSDNSLNLFQVVPGSGALLNSQLVCRRPGGILNSCCCSVPSFR